MPNHCLNTLIVVGSDKDEFDKFTDAITAKSDDDNQFSLLRAFIPAPDFGGSDDWYDWCIKHWGTKWGEYDANITNIGTVEFSANFTTAWAPPVTGYLTISKMFPTMTFSLSYREDGMGLLGTVIMENGNIIGEAHAAQSDWPDMDSDSDYDEYDEKVMDLAGVLAMKAADAARCPTI